MDRITRAGLLAPAAVLDVDVECRTSAPVDEGPIDVSGYRTAYCLLRSDGIPTAMTFWDVDGDDSVDPAELVRRAEADGVVEAPTADERNAVPAPGDMTVALCTRERPDDLRRAIASLEAQSDPAFTLLVVDNAPTTGATEEVVADSSLAHKVYVVEPRPGLSRARNRALAHVSTDYVAWFDDDETADRDWVRCLKEGFSHRSRPAAVSGLMLPAELESEAQIRFEQYGGFNKGRGVAPEVLRARTPSVRNPLYPLPGFGAGGNMAFRTEALHRIGGFDQYLGAGTRTHGGEETLAFSSLLRMGEAVLHWPPAITWHYHRRDMPALERQLFGYSAGLSAFYASVVRSRPLDAFQILKIVPHGLHDALPQEDSLRSGHLPDDFPKHILQAARRGFIKGAFLYLGEVRAGRRGTSA